MFLTNVEREFHLKMLPAGLFRMRGWGDRVFMISPDACYMGNKFFMYVVQVQTEHGFLDFSKGTLDELKNLIMEVKR